MALQHAVIPDSKRHEAKGASTASSGQVLSALGGDATLFVNPSTLSNINVNSILEGQSLVAQNPSTEDTPLQVTFGSLGSNSNVSIASTGLVTILATGLYFITLNLNFGRSTDTDIALLFSRMYVNDAAIGFVQSCKLNASTETASINQSFLRAFTANDVFKVEIMRDSTGENDGGLVSLNPELTGWANSPSAAIRIQKVAGGS